MSADFARRWGSPWVPAIDGHTLATNRLLVLFEHPARVARGDADGWLRAQLAAIAALDDVQRAQLSVLEPGSRRCPRARDRLLELELAHEVQARGWADSGRCGDWLAELRSLGLRPVVVLSDRGTSVGLRERA